MASTYSTNLALELIGTGEQSGTWGVTTNTNLGTLLEQAISGYVTQAITDGSGANTTITIPNGATGVARNMFIEMTGALTFSTTSLIVPANKKLYFIYNNTTGGFAVTVKVSGQTGVSVPNGKKVILVSNGTDIVNAENYISSLSVGALTSGRVPYAGTSGLLQDSANLTFNGTTLTAAGFSGPISGVVTSTSITDSGLTSGRVTYASTGGLLVDSANLQFDGTNLGINKTPSAWGSSLRALQFNSGSYISDTGGGSVAMVYGIYNNGTNWIYATTGVAVSYYAQEFGVHQWFKGASGTSGGTATLTESMRIDTSGNVGIGTTAPDAKLNVYGGLATTGIVARLRNPVSGGNTKIGFTDTLTYNWTAGTTGDTFTISSAEYGTTAGAERMRLDSSGNLMVGTTSASGRLTVSTIETKGQNATAAVFGTSTGGANDFQLIFARGTNSYYSIQSVEQSVSTRNLVLQPSGGSVGIGTTSPSEILDIQGSGDLKARLYTTSTSNAGLTLKTGSYEYIIQNTTTTAGSAGDLRFFDITAGAERMRIDSSGNLMVGTTSALGKLTISGGKTVISSTSGDNGQLQIGNSTSTGEASMCFISGASAFGTTPTSVNGNQYIWGVGAGIYGIGGNSWGIGNTAAGTYLAKIAYNGSSWVFSSDERLKNLDGNIENAVDKVNTLRAVYFTWKNDETKKRKVGLIAQDVLAVLPEAVDKPEQDTKENGDPNYLGLGMSDVVPLLVAAIQELKAEVDALKSQINQGV